MKKSIFAFEDCASSLGSNLRKSKWDWHIQFFSEVTQYYYVKGDYIREGFAMWKLA